ncbi:MAG TPA: hypothetical protein VF411_00320 [Bacteroidia bacterium]
MIRSTFKKAKVAFDFQKDTASELCTYADGTVTGLTGNTTISVVPVPIGPATNPLSIMALTAVVRGFLARISAGDKSTTLTTLLTGAVNDLMQGLTSNGHSIEDQANTIARGDLNRAHGIITSTGNKLKKKGVAHPRSFEGLKSDRTTLHLRWKAVKLADYGVRYAPTTGENVFPAALPTAKIIPNGTTQLIITGLRSGTWIAVQYGYKLRIPHTGTGTATGAATQRTATPVASAKHVPTYADGTEPLLWSYTIYLLVP